MSHIPDDLAHVVRQSASPVAAYQGGVDEIRRRWRRRRRRRLAAASAVAGVAVAAAVGPAFVGGTAGGPPATTTAGGTAAPTAAPVPAQRLLLGDAGIAVGAKDSSAPAGINEGISEVLPDSSITRHPVPAIGGWYRILALPDGRLVGLGYDPVPPGVRDGESTSPRPAVRLVVLSPTGTVELRRTVAVLGEPVRLVAATAQAAYLWRPAGLVEHDLSTGREHTVLATAALGELPDVLPASRADVLDGRFVLAGTRADPCRLRVVDLGTGSATELGMARFGCTALTMVRISPRADRAAVSYQQAATTGSATAGQLRIAIVNLSSGEIEGDSAVVKPAELDGTLALKQPAGMAWLDDSTVRAAVADRGDADGTYRPDEVHLMTIRAH